MNWTRIRNAINAVALAATVGALNEMLAISSSIGLDQPWPEVVALVLTWAIGEVKALEAATGEPVPASDQTPAVKQ